MNESRIEHGVSHTAYQQNVPVKCISFIFTQSPVVIHQFHAIILHCFILSFAMCQNHMYPNLDLQSDQDFRSIILFIK